MPETEFRMEALSASESVSKDGRARPQTKERILEAAVETFAEKGYYATAVDDIVQASNTSKGSFYNFFPSKQGIFMSLVDKVSAKMIERIESSIDEQRGALNKVDAALRGVVDHFSRHKRLARILLIEAAGLGHAFNEKLFHLHTSFAGLIQKYLDAAVEEGSIDPIDTELAAYAWLGAINEIVLRWLHTGKPHDLRDTLPDLRRHLLRSIGAPCDLKGEQQ